MTNGKPLEGSSTSTSSHRVAPDKVERSAASPFRDNARVRLAGSLARVIAPHDREAITEGHDKHGVFLRFTTREGDRSANEIASYGKDRPAPRRAFITIEDRGNQPRWGERIVTGFGLVIEQGPTIREGGLHVTFAQENAYPNDGKSWRSPPMEFGLIVRNHPDPKQPGRPLKDSTGRPLLFEHLELTIRSGKNEVVSRIASKAPIPRGRLHRIGLAYTDSRGEPGGAAEYWMDGELQGRYRGPTGYAGFRSPYPAIGVYCHAGQVSPISARVYDYDEQVKPAP